MWCFPSEATEIKNRIQILSAFTSGAVLCSFFDAVTLAAVYECSWRNPWCKSLYHPHLFCLLFSWKAYASGCDVVILGSDFERLQIIPGAKHGNIQVGCVDCSLQGGQVRLMERGNCNCFTRHIIGELHCLIKESQLVSSKICWHHQFMFKWTWLFHNRLPNDDLKNKNQRSK